MNVTTLQRIRTKMMCLKDRIDGVKNTFSKDLSYLYSEIYKIHDELKALGLNEKLNKNSAAREK